MKTIDNATLREWLDLDLEGELGGSEKALLANHLAGDVELAADRRALVSLHAMLAADRLAVRPGFKSQVLAGLPAAAWERQRSLAWALPMAVMLLAGLMGSWLLAASSSAFDSHVWATGVAILDFVGTGMLAGAGLLTASWRGIGMGLEELLATSVGTLAVFAVFVLCLDLLVVHMLRRRRSLPAEAACDAVSAELRRDSDP